MRKYIFFTNAIHLIGGGQLYVAGKAKYLESIGWQVYMIHNDPGYGESEVPFLTKYICDFGFPENMRLPYKTEPQKREEVLNRMISLLHIDNHIQNEIIIESYTSVFAMWAELLAEKIGARHFFVAVEEMFREKDIQFYGDNLDFFYFKYKRNEIISDELRLNKLFNGYRNGEHFKAPFPPDFHHCMEIDAVQDVYYPHLNEISKSGYDFTIAYVGRTEKNYFLNICDGIAEFAKNHPDKQIRFLIVGRFIVEAVFDKMHTILKNGSNIHIWELGNLVPIPRSLFKYIDVVCAGSGSALFSAHENVPVILAITDSNKAHGVLYYDTSDALFAKDSRCQTTYADALEKVLIRREYANRKPSFPDLKPADWYYERVVNFQLSNSEPFEYFTERFKEDLQKPWVALFPFSKVERGSKVVFYGYTPICQDYLNQIKDYCEVVAIVSNDHDQYDMTVLPPEKLVELEYDWVIISEIPLLEVLRAAIDRIIQITGKANILSEFYPVFA